MAEYIDITNEFEDKKEFIRTAARVLGWNSLYNEDILYAFCGNGRKYTRIFLQYFPKIRTVFLIDILDAINAENILRKTELFSADFQNISRYPEYKEYFLHIVSIDCFNWLKLCKSGFVSIYHLLKPKGTAAVLMNINSPYEDCYHDLIENSIWKYSELGQESMFPKFPVRLNKDEYIKFIQDLGFIVLQCDDYYRIFEFESLVDFYEKCTNFTSALLAYIPKEQHQVFLNDYLDNFKRLNGLSYRKRPRVKYKTVTIYLNKPASSTESSSDKRRVASSEKTKESVSDERREASSTSSTFSPYSFSQFGRF